MNIKGILILAYSAAERQSIGFILEQKSIPFITTDKIGNALKVLSSLPVDLIITDSYFHDKSSFKRKIESDAVKREIALLVLFPESHVDRGRSGALNKEWLVKPYSANQLLSSIGKLMRLKRAAGLETGED